jgi:hypothetical protein
MSLNSAARTVQPSFQAICNNAADYHDYYSNSGGLTALTLNFCTIPFTSREYRLLMPLAKEFDLFKSSDLDWHKKREGGWRGRRLSLLC